MKLRALLIPALVALSLSLAACGGGSDDSTGAQAGETTEVETTESEPAPSGEAARAEKVEIVEFAFQPDPVVVQVGGKVNWQNEDTAPHTATADDGSFDTGTLEKGKLKSETFKEAGTFPYFCEIHPTMHGTVEVVEKD
ncbi:MAG: cupredoxin domain-containing protein [Thermoleophilia bacterium]|nr:cupredoxin domain-containing protein [Thermoleophilia bacterium]